MTKADEIKRQMAELEAELEGLPPHETMTVRELARKSGVSPATAARFKAGDVADMQLSTVTKLMPFTRACPCCGQVGDPSAWPLPSTDEDQVEGAPLFAHHQEAGE